MKIGDKQVREIIVTNKEDELLATITDNDVIFEDGIKVVLRCEVD